MGKILTIGVNTFREAIRNKILYSLLFFALLVIVASLAFGALSVREEVRLTTDLGLAGISLFSIIIAIFVGVNLVYKELERKTIYSLIPKPVHRYQFVLGKYLGMMMTLAVLVAIMTLVLAVVLVIQGETQLGPLLKMVVLIYLEVMVITAVAVLFSSYSTPFLSGLFTIGIFMIGRNIPEIHTFAARMEEQSTTINNLTAVTVRGVSHIIPNLRYFFVTGTDSGGAYISVHEAGFPDWSYVGTAGGYALLYVFLTLSLAMVLFSRRDFI